MGSGTSGKPDYHKKNGSRTVNYEQWGKPLQGSTEKTLRDANGDLIGYIRDEQRYVSEPVQEPVDRREMIGLINSYRNDDGTYGDENIAVYVAYSDGTMLDGAEIGKSLSRKGKTITGLYLSTPDEEAAWGGSYRYKNGQRIFEEWTTTGDEDEGIAAQSNARAYYRTVGTYWTRQKITFNNPNGRGGYRTKREEIRRSTVKPVGDRL